MTTGWLGEVEGLSTGLAAATEKVSSLDRMAQRQPGTSTNLGMPVIHQRVIRPESQ